MIPQVHVRSLLSRSPNMNTMNTVLVVAGLLAPALCSPTPVKAARQAAVSPQIASATLLANVTDPSVSRDSCGSSRIGNRLLWTCRDTETYDVSTGQATDPLNVNTASWTNFNSDAGPDINAGGPVGAGSSGANEILQMYGGSPQSSQFYPIQPGECSSGGFCDDNTRWVGWPNQPPVMTSSGSDGSGTGYTWVPNQHIRELTALNPEPTYGLWRVDYTPGDDPNALPTTTLVSETFWQEGQIGYGAQGSMLGPDGNVYLYGVTDQDQGTTLAKVPAGSVEDLTQYQYYVGGSWTTTMPGINDTSAIISNAGAGGQGSYYYSDHLSTYVWIGQSGASVFAQFFLTTAPAPEGPWIAPYEIYKGADGDYPGIGSYSLQAHYDMLSPATENGIYITWTQQWDASTYGGYVTPLVYLAFQ